VGEIAGQVRGNRHKCGVVGRLPDANTFVVPIKIPTLVFVEHMWNHQRATQRNAELVPAKWAYRRHEKAPRVEDVVAEVFPRIAVDFVGAGFRDYVDGCPGSMAVCG